MSGGDRCLGASVLALCAGLVAVGCAPATPSLASMRSAADARIGNQVAAPDKNVGALLAQPLTPESATRIALLNNRSVNAAFEELGLARAGLVHALRLPNPAAEGAIRFAGSDKPQLEVLATIDLSELLFLPWRGGVASAQVEAAKLSVLGFMLDLAFDAQVAFYDYVAACQMLELRRTVLGAMRASVEAAESLRQAGNITDLDLATERQFLEQARVAFARAETEASATRERLSATLGLWGANNTWSAPARLPEPPGNELSTETLEQHAVERSVDLAMARTRYAAAAKRANLARAEGWLPELKAGVSAQRDSGWSVGPAAEIQIPLLYQGQGQVDAALAEARRQENVHEDLAVHVRAAARTAATRLRSARESALHYRSVVLPLGDQVLGETQLQYNAMGVGVFQLLQTKREQIEAARTYVELLRDYWVARTEVARLEAGRVNRAELGSEELIRESTPLERGRGGLEQP